MGLRDRIRRSQLWRSVFRHDYRDSKRNRLLQVASNVFLHLHPPRVPAHSVRTSFTFGLGGVTFLLYLITVVTGVVLMFYYRPTTEYAYADMKNLEYDIPFGMLMRNMHRWAAHLMVICVWLHMLRVFLTGSYKPPREFNWVIGVGLLTLTMFLSFTGYLLPWDQLSLWAVTVGTNMARYTPIIGHEGPFAELSGLDQSTDMRALLLGSPNVGGPALLRFYVLHCVAVPLVMTALLVVHFWRVRKDGGISGPREGEP